MLHAHVVPFFSLDQPCYPSTIHHSICFPLAIPPSVYLNPQLSISFHNLRNSPHFLHPRWVFPNVVLLCFFFSSPIIANYRKVYIRVYLCTYYILDSCRVCRGDLDLAFLNDADGEP